MAKLFMNKTALDGSMTNDQLGLVSLWRVLLWIWLISHCLIIFLFVYYIFLFISGLI